MTKAQKMTLVILADMMNALRITAYAIVLMIGMSSCNTSKEDCPSIWNLDLRELTALADMFSFLNRESWI